jgi:hypothetical protein
VKEGGALHVVSYTSQAQNDQIIAVVETGLLGLELGRSSLAAKAGQTVSLPVSIRRGKGLTGPVKVELVVPEHVQGVKAASVELTGEQTAGALAVSFAAKAGPFNQPLIVRATLKTAQGPVTAEAKVEVVGEE